MLPYLFILITTLTSLISLEFFIIPFAWIFLLWFLVFFYAARTSKKGGSAQLIYFNISLVLLILGIYELYLGSKEIERYAITESNRNRAGNPILWYTENDILGYAPKKNITVHTTKKFFNELVFDVVYTLDKNGLRVTSPSKENNQKECILFLGDSLTFGEGVNEQQTLPYLTSLKTNQQFQVYNFAFRGYGPHQMLASLEQGRIANIAQCQPQYAIYQAIDDHVSRAAGLSAWDPHGPKYILKENGDVVRDGHFDDRSLIPSNFITRKIKTNLQKSLIIEKIFFKQRPTNQHDVDLMVGIVDKFQKNFEARYPDSEFHVIFWDANNAVNKAKIIKGMKSRNIKLHLISDILPNYQADPSVYRINKYDPHPNALANQILADYVTKNIIKK
jgi:hypothetical protein